MEPLQAQLWLGQRGRGAAEPEPQRAQRSRGLCEALPAAGGEGSLHCRREGTAAALPQVWPELLAQLPAQRMSCTSSLLSLCVDKVARGAFSVSESIDLVVVSCG